MKDKSYLGETTLYGFKWGPVEVKRACSDPKLGVWLLIDTERESLQVRITRTGFIRVYGAHPVKKQTTKEKS